MRIHKALPFPARLNDDPIEERADQVPQKIAMNSHRRSVYSKKHYRRGISNDRICLATLITFNPTAPFRGLPHTTSSTGGSDYATAHDLRRAFGVRWSQRVMPPVLMEMMRHAEINTTMEFYVGRNAERAVDDAWSAYKVAVSGNKTGNSFVETDPKTTKT